MVKAHSIGYCTNCGWVHRTIRRVSVEEGEKAVIKALCVDCIKKREHQVICDLCGRVKGTNLYPVSIMRKMIKKDRVCNLFVHLCAECRGIPHSELLKRFNVPPDICDTCSDRFICFSNKGQLPLKSVSRPATLDGKTMVIHQNWLHKIGRRMGLPIDD